MQNPGFFEDIRNEEISKVIKYLPKGATILEIGAGAGWQAKMLEAYGFNVKAIDIEESNYNDARIYDVKVYDGFNIPFDDEFFDVVFSSNVLEHISHVKEFQKEIARVLKNDGFAIHILPSASWRFWTSVSFYLRKLKLNGRKNVSDESAEKEDTSTAKRSLSSYIIPERHGERGNVLSEIIIFSKKSWIVLFKNTGWKIRKVYPNHLFYTGDSLLNSKMSIQTRRRLSFLLGSSCNIFLLKK